MLRSCALFVVVAAAAAAARGVDFADELPGTRKPPSKHALDPKGDPDFAPNAPDPLFDYALTEPFSAGVEEVPQLLKAAYNRISFDLQEADEEHDGFLRAADVPLCVEGGSERRGGGGGEGVARWGMAAGGKLGCRFVRIALNPGNVPLFEDEEEVMKSGIEKLMRKEGLINLPNHRLNVMYLVRGHPLDQIRNIHSELKKLRAKHVAEQEAIERGEFFQAEDAEGGGEDEFASPGRRKSRRSSHDEL
jgi:hypothetical protein